MIKNNSDKLGDNTTKKGGNTGSEEIFYDIDPDSPKVLVELLKRKGLRIAVADGCTGGLAAKMITDISGSSSVFEGGVINSSGSVNYNYFGELSRVFNKYDPYDHKVAIQMAEGIKYIMNADVCIGITGITEYKRKIKDQPVGTVYIAVNYKKRKKVNKFNFDEDLSKEEICELAVLNAFAMVIDHLENTTADDEVSEEPELKEERAYFKPCYKRRKRWMIIIPIVLVFTIIALEAFPLLFDDGDNDRLIVSYDETDNLTIKETVETDSIGDESAYTDDTDSESGESIVYKEVLPLEGKKIVCMGDSLFGRNRDETSALYMVAEMTGADVSNVAFGGSSMARVGHGAFSYFSLPALTDAIISGSWADQDANVTAAVGWDEQLPKIKAIDFSEVDILLIHYGTNDFMVPHALEGNDVSSVSGALRYSLDKLSSAYPQLKFCISLPVYRYWGSEHPDTYTNPNGAKLTDFIEGIRSVATEYDLPVIDGFYGMDINKDNAVFYLEDETHHNREGRRMFGIYIGKCLIDYYKE